MTPAAVHATLKVEPWLAPYVRRDDDGPGPARKRFEAAQRVVLRRMEADGFELHRRYVKAGMLTTAIDHRGTVRR